MLHVQNTSATLYHREWSIREDREVSDSIEITETFAWLNPTDQMRISVRADCWNKVLFQSIIYVFKWQRIKHYLFWTVRKNVLSPKAIFHAFCTLVVHEHGGVFGCEGLRRGSIPFETQVRLCIPNHPLYSTPTKWIINKKPHYSLHLGFTWLYNLIWIFSFET